MKKIVLSTVLILGSLLISGCTSDHSETFLDSSDQALLDVAVKSDTGSGSFEILNTPILSTDNELSIMASGIDESKITYIYVANQKVFEQKMKNDTSYTLTITSIKDAHKTDYSPKVQLVQYDNDKEDGDITTFKQEQYKVQK